MKQKIKIVSIGMTIVVFGSAYTLFWAMVDPFFWDRQSLLHRPSQGASTSTDLEWAGAGPMRLVSHQGVRVEPLVNAHAHNDYEHERPLWDALEFGFTSIEADVYLVDGELLVAHDFSKVSKNRTLEGLYLRPLAERSKLNHGKIFPNGPAILLLVDIKRDGVAAFRVLNELLARYQSVVSEFSDGRYDERAITVVVSGDRPKEEIAKSNPRFAGIDGRIGDLDSNNPSHLMPLISDNWTTKFTFRGEGDMPAAEKEQLQEYVRKAHMQGRRIRFWATPENENLWKELRDAKVDLIGTDRLAKLAQFLSRQTEAIR